MAGTTLQFIGGPPGTPPPADRVVVYPKTDKLLYFMGSDGVEHALAGQVEAGALIKGSDGTILAGGAGIAQVARNGVGNITVTLSVATTGNRMPRATAMDTTFANVVCDLPVAPPTAMINIYTFNAAGAPMDASSVLFNMIRLAV